MARVNEKLASLNWGQFSPLADPTRRAIFTRLMEHPAAVKVLAAEMPISQPAISQHLKVLKEADLILDERQGRYRLYSANPQALEALSLQFGQLRDCLLDDGESQGTASGEFDSVDRAMQQWARLWPEHDPLSVGLIVRLRLVARHLERLSELAASRHQLNVVQVLLLATLDRIEPPHESTLTELSKVSFMSLPATARHLDQTEKRGLISRRPDENDARSNLIRITDKGREVLHKIMNSQRQHEHAPVYQMTGDDQLRLARMLRSLMRDLGTIQG
ncbi:hypothetical protein DM872_29695 [Pseudomonas taiwanensis]|uniref:metalloregulator ArsR/SmtB family transcription factor n=1 Tax=Pseudomonas taiwanensis TaxID=470150 RepID=UPI0015BE5F29|nr:metalloregulator ArsR/SmtB family transcription factor [Pseudomonas taiwanensis]NWL81033.1 hypothetical protein [Pseudomonas taiwanensis]